MKLAHALESVDGSKGICCHDWQPHLSIFINGGAQKQTKSNDQLRSIHAAFGRGVTQQAQAAVRLRRKLLQTECYICKTALPACYQS